MSMSSLPNPFLLHGLLRDKSPPHHKTWTMQTQMEYQKQEETLKHPPSHIILVIVNACDGSDDKILPGEVAAIVTAIRNRLKQPNVDGYDDERKEALFDQVRDNPSDADRLPPSFATEARFPVLMVSFLGPQHGRMFYASMDGGKLVIQQSRLYSFEKKNTAPWDIFTCWLLGRPLSSKPPT